MKAKLKPSEKDTSVVIGANPWDGTVTIDGKSYEPGKEYDVSKKVFDTGQFTEIKPKKGSKK